eukprot:1052891-Ditylum_brightwellii.AAC.1
MTKNSKTTTLVVTPLSLISQWQDELETKTSLLHHVHYGADVNSKKRGIGDGTIQGEYILTTGKKRKNASSATIISVPLLSFKWDRVILDEAHNIKNPSTAVSRGCCAINASRRWCVTGTPVQNSLQDVFGLLKFLKHEPWCEAGFWKAAVLRSAVASVESSCGSGDVARTQDTETQEGMKMALGRVRRVLSPLMLRRTKDTLTKDG